ncbi:putative quinol monooxygenase [Clostridium beijerinckii]|uniref:ABM domain-containing protein n=2 Tax=Clostridium beijerinckii TaxID=1520 RepID=A0A1S9N470_CLOBE|nr:antibiotic biosynthesis monooxygenase [Clostridium beijerinckii]MZK51445.1 hypothetical protein [Clostridium beijerinckii]MZK59645.1 hypothetical protein [Clostridium beijerinckii]MZK69765.1 hypothetical protein [Clostridium beijerinckii]MZK75143.1 hypothetical protein [Clostridium beijerinckii]MZK84855.1 hypothetical protein [Clostridium beijerinckii]
MLKNIKSLYKNQPGVVLRMHAKPGKGDELFQLTTNLHYNGDPDGPVDWALCRSNEEPDTLWAFEFYRDDESFTRHYSNPAMDEGHNKVFDLLADMPLRADVHIVSSNNTSDTTANVVNEKSLYKNQPGVVLRMYAKPEKGADLFELTTNLHYNGDPDGPVDWVLCESNEEPDTLWGFEFYRDDESFTRHYSNPAMDEGHQKVIDLLADMPLRDDIHIEASNNS